MITDNYAEIEISTEVTTALIILNNYTYLDMWKW